AFRDGEIGTQAVANDVAVTKMQIGREPDLAHEKTTPNPGAGFTSISFLSGNPFSRIIVEIVVASKRTPIGRCTVRRLALGMAFLFVGLCVLSAHAADEEKDSAKAAKTRELLKKKVSLNFKMEFLKDILEEIQDQVKGVKFKVDTKGGVSQNKRMTIMV